MGKILLEIARRLRPNLVFIAVLLTVIILVDLIDNGDPKIGLMAATALATMVTEIARKD